MKKIYTSFLICLIILGFGAILYKTNSYLNRFDLKSDFTEIKYSDIPNLENTCSYVFSYILPDKNVENKLNELEKIYFEKKASCKFYRIDLSKKENKDFFTQKNKEFSFNKVLNLIEFSNDQRKVIW